MASYHHGFIASYHHGIIASWHHDIISSNHHGFIASYHYGFIASCHHGIISLWLHSIISSWHHGNVRVEGTLYNVWNESLEDCNLEGYLPRKRWKPNRKKASWNGNGLLSKKKQGLTLGNISREMMAVALMNKTSLFLSHIWTDQITNRQNDTVT